MPRPTLWRSASKLMHRKSLWALLILTLITIVTINFWSFGLTQAATMTTDTQPTYVDKKLGFSIQLSIGWVAIPQPGLETTANSEVLFTNATLPGTRLEVGVMRSSSSSAAAADFALRGKSTLSIGAYPAFKADTPRSKQVATPCLIRVMLADTDVVVASWCAQDAALQATQFEGILATYRMHSLTSAPVNAVPHIPLNPVLNCSQVMQNAGPNMWGTLPPAADTTFGAQVVSPNDPVWTNNFGEGVAVCNDYYTTGGYMWENSYLFQCVELANRFINEEWGLSEFSVDAFAYYDYYLNGTFYPGQARTLFGSQVQLTDDASQGNNSTPPQPGDLLIFQDVKDGVHWTSGEINTPTYLDPGHVVVVTSVTSTQVNIVQQNWHNGEKYSFALQKWSNGYHIVDNSGWSGRITRGWIHFSANNGITPSTLNLASSPAVAYNAAYNHSEVFALAADGTIWHDWPSGNGAWTNWSLTQSGLHFQGTPAVIWNPAANRLDVFALASDGTIWHDWPSSNGTWANWTQTQSGLYFHSSPVVVYNAARNVPEIFALAADGTIWYDWPSPNGTWANWTQTQSNMHFQGTPAVTYNMAYNHPEIFALAADGTMWHDWPSASGTWTNWSLTQSGLHFQGTPTLTWNPAVNRLDVFALAANGTIWHDWPSPNGTWANWTQTQSSSSFQGNPVVAYNAAYTHPEVFALPTDGTTWHDWPSGNGAWANWSPTQPGLHFQSTPAVIWNPAAHRLDVFALASDGTIWHDWPSPNGTWANWTQTQSGTHFQ